MSTEPLALSAHLSRRIEKLAEAAGRTPAGMLKFVIRDGLEYCEYAVKAINGGLADLATGKTESIDAVQAHFAKRRATRRAKKAA